MSYTTRAPREGELNGREYHFVDTQKFETMLEAGEFLESALVHGNYYGTSQAWIAAQRTDGHDILLEIDWQGAAQVRDRLPEAIDIFILPPSREALEQRLRGRGTDSEEVIQRRLRDSVTELSRWGDFRYVVVNEHFDRALADLQHIVAGDAEPFRSTRPDLDGLTARLIG